MRRAAVHIGNRGTVLGLLGLIWTLTGVGLISEPGRKYGVLDEHLPEEIRAALWLLPGLLALVAVALRKLDPWAWGLLILPVAIRGGSFLLGWIGSYGPAELLGDYALGWRSVLLYASIGLMVNRCAAGLDRPATWDGRERRRGR